MRLLKYRMVHSTDSIKHKEDFLKDVEQSIEPTKENEAALKRLEFVKNKLLERVKASNMRSLERRGSVSSLASGGSESKKRQLSAESESDRTSVRSKTSPVSPAI